MNNNVSNNSKFIITYQSNIMNIDLSGYESLSNDEGIELANIINKAHNDGYKTVINCNSLDIFPDSFYNSINNLSYLGFKINGQLLWYDDIKDAIDNSLGNSAYYNVDDSIQYHYGDIKDAILKLGSIVDNSELTNIKNQIDSLKPCYKELPSSGCIGKITTNVNNCINTVNDIYNRLVNFRNFLRDHDPNFDYYANLQYMEGLEEFGEGLTEVEKYYVVNDIKKEIQGYKNVGDGEGMISSEVHQSVLDACNNYLDYYGYTGADWILSKSERTSEEQKFINRLYNTYSRKDKSELTDLQLYSLELISQNKAGELLEEYLSTHKDMVGDSFEEILAGRQSAIDSYTEANAGYAVDDLSSAFFEAGKKDIEDKYDECVAVYNKYLDYLEVGYSSIETSIRREYASKLPAGISEYNSDYYSEYLTADKSDFLISRDLKHNDDRMSNLGTEINELNNEFKELTNQKNLLSSQISQINSMWCPTEDDYEEARRLQAQVDEIDRELNTISSKMASRKNLIDTFDNNSFNLYTKFSNFGELCNSNIADYKISRNFWNNQVIEFYDKDGNKLDVSTEEGAIYIYTNQISFDKDIVIDEKYSYSRELKKMMNDVNQFKFDSVIDVDYFKVLNYLDNTANDTKFQYYYDRKYDDCLRIEGKLLADARTNVLDAHCSFVDFFSLTGWGLVDGVNQFIDGFVNLVSADGRPSAKQYMSMYMAEYINDNYSCDEIMQGAYEISTSIGNMLPSIAASFIPVVGPYLGRALMGLSAAGNARENGLQQGMASDEAWVYGILSGASEVFLEMGIGGIPGLSNMAKFAGMHGLKALVAKGLSESFEESLQEVLDPVFKWIATGDWDGIDVDNVMKAGVYAFITAGILNGGSFITDVASMSMFGDYTAIGHIANKYSGTDLLNQEIVKSIKNDFKILKNSKTELSSLVEDLSQNETVKSAYESLSDKQKEMINFEDYVSGIAIDATLLVGNNTTIETVNAEAVKKIKLELEELNNSKIKIEEAIKANREARNNTKDLAESLKLDDELIELNNQLKSFNGQISILNDLLSGNSLATSSLDPKQFALDLLNDPETAYNIYLTAKLSVEDIANKTDIENRIELEIKDLIKQKSDLIAELTKLSSELEKAKTEYQKDVDNDSKYNKYNDLSMKYEETVSKIQDKLDTVNKQIEEMSSNEYLQKLISEEISQLKDQEFSLKDKLAEARKELADAKKKYQETKESDIKNRDINYDNMEKASEKVEKLQLDLKNLIYKLNKYIIRSQMLSNIEVIEAETVSKIDQLIEKYNSIDNNGMSFYIELSSVSDITLEQLSNIKDSEHIKFKINDQIYSYEQIKSMINTNSTLVSKLLSEISSLFNIKEVIDGELISEDENVVSLLEKTGSKISSIYKSIVASISNSYNSAIESLNTKVSESINAIKDLIESIKKNNATDIDKSSVSVNVPLLDSGDYDFKEFFKTADHDEIILTIKNNLNNNDFFTQLANYCSSEVFDKKLYYELFSFDSLVPSLRSNYTMFTLHFLDKLSTNFDEILDMVLSKISVEGLVKLFNPNIIDYLGPVNRAKLEQQFPGIIDKVLSSPYSAIQVINNYLKEFLDFDNHKYTFSNIPKEQWNAEIIKYLTIDKGLTYMFSSKVVELLKIDEFREKLISSQELCDYLNKNRESVDNQKELFYLLENDVIYSKIDKNSIFFKNYINYNLDNGNFNKLSFSDVLNFYRDTKNSSSEISISSSVENYFINYVSQSDIIDRYKMETREFSQTDVQELIDCMSAIADFGISNYEKINVSVDEYNQMFNYINRLLLENNNIIDVEHYQRHIYNFARHFANLNNYFDLKIELYYNEEDTAMGEHGDKKVKYNKFYFNNEKSIVPVARNLETVLHEIIHEMQERERNIHSNSNTMNKYSLISTIDDILKFNVGSENKYTHTNNNYETILDEIDARYNAQLLLLNYIKEILPDSSELQKSLMEQISRNEKMYDLNANYMEYDGLFINRDIVLDKLVKSNLNLLEKYPLLKYIYNENGTRKSIFELIEMRDSISDSNVVSAINYWIKNCNYSLESLATVLYEYECKTTNLEKITKEEHAIIGDIKAFKLIETLMSESEYFSDEDFIAKITDICERIGRENGNMSDADSVKNTLIREYLLYKGHFDENIHSKIIALNSKQFMHYVDKHINDSDVITDLIMNCTYDQYIYLLNSKLSKKSELSVTEKGEILKYLVKNKDYFSKIIDDNLSRNFSSLCDEILSYIPTNELYKYITLEQINTLSLEQKNLFETKFPGVIDKIIEMSKVTDFSIGNKVVPKNVIEENIKNKLTYFANYGISGSDAAYIYKQYFDYAKRYNIDIPQDIQNFYDQFITLSTFMDFNSLTKDNIGDYFAYKCSILDNNLFNFDETIIGINIKHILDLIDIARKNNIDIESKLTIEQKNLLEFYKERCIFSDYDIISKSNQIYLDFDKVGSDQHSVAYIMKSGDMEKINILISQVEKNYPGISRKEAIKFLNSIEGVDCQGVCNYAATMNVIFEIYQGKENQFLKDFGFPMYIDGKLNDAQLLVDMFSIINEGVLIKKQNSEYVANETNSDYRNLCKSIGSDGFETDLISEYFIKKGFSNINIDSKVLVSDQILLIDDSLFKSLTMKKNYILNKVSDAMKSGKTCHLESGKGLKMVNAKTGKTEILGEAHIMTIFGIDSLGRLRVDSWGREYLIDLESMIQDYIIFDISCLDIYKKNGG